MKDIVDSAKWLDDVTSLVMLSTLESEDLAPMIRRFIIERNIIIQGVAYPMLFKQLTEGQMPDLATYDVTRLMGSVPVSASNLYKLVSMKSHVLLYPGGVCEALHRKGEEYTLFWPEQSEFVRMAARFGATIIPFGAVGEDDYAQLVLDYEDQMKVPFLKDLVKRTTYESIKLSEPFREASISSLGEETNLSLQDTNITKEQYGLGLDLHTLSQKASVYPSVPAVNIKNDSDHPWCHTESHSRNGYSVNHNDVYSYADATSENMNDDKHSAAVESSIISNILSMDFDGCNDDLISPQTVAGLHEGKNEWGGPSWNLQNSDRLRFSFANEHSHANQEHGKIF
ncbi:acyltransferase-like protein, chloroplastic [Tanacetum coccineum]